VLSEDFDVTLSVPQDSSLSDLEFCEILKYHNKSDSSLVSAIDKASVLIIPAIWIKHIKTPPPSVHIVVDGYDPFIVETLALGYSDIADMLQVLTQAILLGDFFVCASERQRDWWLGLLEANGRINPQTFKEDASLRALVEVVPYGLPKSAPYSSGPIVKGVWSGIGPDDKVILWGGGLWPWLDPMTAIRAMAKVWQHRQDVRLIFPGTKHPNPGMGGIPSHTSTARELASEMGLLNKAVFFGDWVPYEEWPGVLVESDLALTLHFDTLETRLAFRSRVLDYVWAGLPTVATKGDTTSELISTYGLGSVVEYESVDGVASAITQLLETPRREFTRRFETVRETLTWEMAAQPLLAFCRHPRKAPDKVALEDDLGNPHYMAKQQQLIEERDHWHEVVKKYEQGRFMRLMRWLHRLRRKLEGHRL
jgi:glycosyltransferase involved in cell wall biosynthesis